MNTDQLQTIRARLESLGIVITDLVDGIVLLTGQHGSLTVFDLSQFTERDLQRLCRIKK